MTATQTDDSFKHEKWMEERTSVVWNYLQVFFVSLISGFDGSCTMLSIFNKYVGHFFPD